jgi:hypothetical protein
MAIRPSETLVEYAARVRRETGRAQAQAAAARTRIAAERRRAAQVVEAARRARETVNA